MKVLVSLLFAFRAEAGIDDITLLQNKKEHQSREVGPLLDRAAAELSSLSSAGVEDAVEDFSKQLKITSMSVLQMPQTEQDALLQRASQGKEFSSFVRSYKSLPQDVQNSVDKAVLLSPTMNKVYDSLQPSDKRSLLMQLDKSTSGKNCRDVQKEVHGKLMDVRECTTGVQSGDPGHRYVHWSGDKGSGTETTTRNKDGEIVHQHSHSYTHDGNGLNPRTETATSGKGSYSHDHSHDHKYENGRTVTKTETKSVGIDGEWTHGHSHDHSFKDGEGTTTATRTESKMGWATHTHDHDHEFDPQKIDD